MRGNASDLFFIIELILQMGCMEEDAHCRRQTTCAMKSHQNRKGKAQLASQCGIHHPPGIFPCTLRCLLYRIMVIRQIFPTVRLACCSVKFIFPFLPVRPAEFHPARQNCLHRPMSWSPARKVHPEKDSE